MAKNVQSSDSNTLEQMVFKMFKYQQRQKYWTLAKFLIVSLLMLGIAGAIIQPLRKFGAASSDRVSSTAAEHVALIDLKGTIWGGFTSTEISTADSIIPQLNRAFKNPKAIALVLRINSPGGTAVQSGRIYEAIQYLRQKYPKPIYAICEETCTSAAYHIAAACTDIYASQYALVGSIGTLLGVNGFGYVDALKKLGIERRLITAGNHKGMLDPFSPLRSEDITMVQAMQADMHEAFIEDVKAGRGDRLQNVEKNADVLFSGRYWTARQALSLGLIDGIGSLDSVVREVVGSTTIFNYTPQVDWFTQFRKVWGGYGSMNVLQRGPLSSGQEPVLGLMTPVFGLIHPITDLV